MLVGHTGQFWMSSHVIPAIAPRLHPLDSPDYVKKSGFLLSERQWLTELMATGWVDVVRKLHPDVAGPYSWWSWRGRAFDNDAGWRIDYQLATPALAGRARAARVERAAAYALRWSDHAPVTVEYR
jgi:exodeoxyribonuclease III